MGKIKQYLFFIFIVIVSTHGFAQTTPRLDVAVCFKNESLGNCKFRPPLVVNASVNNNFIQFTFFDLDLNVQDVSEIREDAWGLKFTTPGAEGGGSTDSFICTPQDCADNAMGIIANNQNIRVERDPDQQQNHLKGSVQIQLSRFLNGRIPTDLFTLINGSGDSGLIVTVTYSGSSASSDTSKKHIYNSSPYVWRADEGTLSHAPKLSVLARFNGIVVNIKPPEDLSSVKQNAATAEDAPTQLIPALAGNPSGYLLMFWKAVDLDGTQPCFPTGSGWEFGPNPISYNLFEDTSTQVPTLTCTYPVYNEDVDSIGGFSSNLGCSALNLIDTNTAPYLQTDSAVPDLTAETVAVPLNFITTELKKAELEKLIKNPSKEFTVPGTCQTIVYVPASQASYGKLNVPNGEVYGVTAWTLNSASTEADPTPNLSLNHSNISYMTGGVFTLASLEKDPSLKLQTTDCFVATAASGDINSNSVFYWRVLRDEYLTSIGFTKFYYQHAPKWADWLNEHPKYKPSVHFMLENTGAAFYFTSLYGKRSYNWVVHNTKKMMKSLTNLWEQEAAADEIEDNTSINYDLAIAGGVLFPTSDRALYKKFYPAPTVDFSLASNAIVWTSQIGWSLGLRGDYGYNNALSDVPTLGSATQNNKNALTFLSLDLIGGIRYRHPSFLYLQPGIFAGVGALRLREEGKGVDDDGQNGAESKSQTFGITRYSPVYDLGANLDISLATIFMYSERELALERDVLLRLSASYRLNPSKALEMSGLIVNAGFAFLF